MKNQEIHKIIEKALPAVEHHYITVVHLDNKTGVCIRNMKLIAYRFILN